MPLTNVTTAITAATPITTPSRVSAERSLFAHNDRNAILIASVMFMRSGLRAAALRLPLSRPDPSIAFQFSSPASVFLKTWQSKNIGGGITVGVCYVGNERFFCFGEAG